MGVRPSGLKKASVEALSQMTSLKGAESVKGEPAMGAGKEGGATQSRVYSFEWLWENGL